MILGWSFDSGVVNPACKPRVDRLFSKFSNFQILRAQPRITRARAKFKELCYFG